jgi:predicted transcriptional regulator of viral defense system
MIFISKNLNFTKGWIHMYTIYGKHLDRGLSKKYNAHMKQRLGKLETQFFAYVQMRRLRTIRPGEIASPLQLTLDQERKLLSRLARSGMIARVQRGLYLVPERLQLGGKWSPNGILVINTLMEERGGQYQICGPNAFNRYGLDEQVPVRMYAYNSAISGDRNIGAVALSLIKVDISRLGDTEEFQTAEGVTAVYSSRTRTLVDAVYDWSRFNSLPRAYEWIKNELHEARVDAKTFVNATLRYGDTGTLRRIGVLLDSEGVEDKLLHQLEKALKPTTALIPWIPTKPKRGKINRRWGVVLNEET